MTYLSLMFAPIVHLQKEIGDEAPYRGGRMGNQYVNRKVKFGKPFKMYQKLMQGYRTSTTERSQKLALRLSKEYSRRRR